MKIDINNIELKLPNTYRAKKEEVLKLYNEGIGIQTISKITGIPTTTLHRNMVKDNVIFRNYSNAQDKKKMVLVNPFLNLNDEKVQYWLGFLTADGSIGTTNNNIILGLSTLDRLHLENYKSFIGGDVKIMEIPKINSVRVQFGSKEIKEYLINLGITPNKTKTVELNIPITNHVLRGVFDGDGCISGTTKSYGTYYKWSVVSASVKLINQIKDVIDTLDIKYTFKKHDVLYEITCNNKKGITILKEFLYKDATIFLERKYSKMQAATKEIL